MGAAEAASRLPPGRWAPENWRRLNQLIEDHAFQGRYACFDFDDTLSIHAVDSQLLLYHLYRLNFVLTPDAFAQALLAGIPDLDRPIGRNAEGRAVCTRQVGADLCGDYAWLYQNCVRRGMESERARQTPAYRDFAAKLFWMRGALDQTFPMTVSYPWCVYQLAGYTPEGLYAFSREAVRFATSPGRYGRCCLRSPRELDGETGPISVQVETGTIFSPEMRELLRVLQANGIAVCLISASLAELVRAACDLLGLGIPEAHIFAMRLRRAASGCFQASYDWDWLEPGRYVQTFGPGKSQIITRFLAPRYGGRGPLLVGGDTESDIDMMTDWMSCGDTRAGLILNHSRSRERHPRLWAAAQDARSRGDSPFLLQGLDKPSGRFRPAQDTLSELDEIPPKDLVL